MKKANRLAAIVCILLALIYVGTYGILSLGGRYEPAAWGLAGVKWYAWAPRGFVRDYHWNRALMWTFLPLYYLDTRFWHTEDAMDSGDYPINEVD
jgi:hypothetical protein